MKFVHCSNAKLFGTPKETPFPFDLEEEHFEAFKAVVAACKEKEAEALFVTGNLFAGAPTREMLQTVDELFLTAPKTRVFILTGHDDACSETDIFATYEWKSNTNVFFGDCIQRVFVSKYNLEVTGIGYSNKTWKKVSVDRLTPGRKGKWQVLLLPELPKEDSERLREMHLPFQYIAVGGSTVMLSEVTENAYAPGDFTPTDFSSQLEHGYYVAELFDSKNKKTNVQFVPGLNREYISLRVNADGKVSYDEVAEEAKQIIAKYGEKHIYRINIIGDSSPSLFFEKSKLYGIGNVVDVKDETNRADALQKLLKEHEDDAIGRFIREMSPADDQDIRQKALLYGLDALLKAQRKEA